MRYYPFILLSSTIACAFPAYATPLGPEVRAKFATILHQKCLTQSATNTRITGVLPESAIGSYCQCMGDMTAKEPANSRTPRHEEQR